MISLRSQEWAETQAAEQKEQLAIADHRLDEQGDWDSDDLERIAHEVVAETHRQEDVAIEVKPDDRALLAQNREKLLQAIG